MVYEYDIITVNLRENRFIGNMLAGRERIIICLIKNV